MPSLQRAGASSPKRLDSTCTANGHRGVRAMSVARLLWKPGQRGAEVSKRMKAYWAAKRRFK